MKNIYTFKDLKDRFYVFENDQMIKIVQTYCGKTMIARNGYIIDLEVQLKDNYETGETDFISFEELKRIQKIKNLTNQEIGKNLLTAKICDDFYYLSNLEHMPYPPSQKEIDQQMDDAIQDYVKSYPRLFLTVLNDVKENLSHHPLFNKQEKALMISMCENELFNKKKIYGNELTQRVIRTKKL